MKAVLNDKAKIPLADMDVGKIAIAKDDVGKEILVARIYVTSVNRAEPGEKKASSYQIVFVNLSRLGDAYVDQINLDQMVRVLDAGQSVTLIPE